MSDFQIDVENNLEKLDKFIDEMEKAEGEVVNEQPYAIYIEMPTQYSSSKPPLDPILDWVEINWQKLPSGLKEKGNNNRKQVAYIIQNSIFESGTEGVFFGTKSLQRARQNKEKFIKEYEGEIKKNPEKMQDLIFDVLEFMKKNAEDIIIKEANSTGQLAESNKIVMGDSSEREI